MDLENKHKTVNSQIPILNISELDKKLKKFESMTTQQLEKLCSRVKINIDFIKDNTSSIRNFQRAFSNELIRYGDIPATRVT